jgi:hypothetical protein
MKMGLYASRKCSYPFSRQRGGGGGEVVPALNMGYCWVECIEAENLSSLEEMLNACRILTGNPEGRTPL